MDWIWILRCLMSNFWYLWTEQALLWLMRVLCCTIKIHWFTINNVYKYKHIMILLKSTSHIILFIEECSHKFGRMFLFLLWFFCFGPWNVDIIELYPHLFTFLSIHFAVHNEKASMKLRDDDTSSWFWSHIIKYISIYGGA